MIRLGILAGLVCCGLLAPEASFAMATPKRPARRAPATRKPAVRKKAVRKAPIRRATPRKSTTARWRTTTRKVRPVEFREPVQAVDPTTVPVAESAPAGAVMAQAYSLIGVPYRRGGTSPEAGFDCSGFVQYVFHSAGVDLPRSAMTQFAIGEQTTRDDLRTGDLVFFRSGRGWHVGIYSGSGNFIHSANSRDRVKVTPLAAPYFSRSFLGARRIFPPAALPEPPAGLLTVSELPPPPDPAPVSEATDSPTEESPR